MRPAHRRLIHLTYTTLCLALIVSIGGCKSSKQKGKLCAGRSDCEAVCVDDQCVALTLCTQQPECPAGTCQSGVCWSTTCGPTTPCPYGDCTKGVCIGKRVEIAPGYMSRSEDGDTSSGTDLTGKPQACDVGRTCVANSDCTTGYCGKSGTCAATTSCKALLSAETKTKNGVYCIDPDAAGGREPFLAACDMSWTQENETGGWTLILKTAQSKTFGYNSIHWTTESLLNERKPAPNTKHPGSDAKYHGFNYVAGTTFRLQFISPDKQINGHNFYYFITAKTPVGCAVSPGHCSALQLFGSNTEHLVLGREGDTKFTCPQDKLFAFDTDEGRRHGFIKERMQFAAGRQFFGINGTDFGSSKTPGEIRFGFGSNDESNNNNWKASHGLGSNGNSLNWGGHTDCDAGGCGCYGPDPILPDEHPLLDVGGVSANLWIR